MKEKKDKKISPKQVAAMICVVLLVGMYVATLIVALLDFPGWDRLFQACLVATIGLPILLWIYIWLYQQIKERKEEKEENQ
ncbi:MAG TPA: PucC family protein [Candidatus Eisenbergiella intestinigallinarum]|uniref:PucC family protein n=1 Tax=Candidatus Eisenbergiella intestinigallinarum TaxID=2838549 RepID=A0A9D2TSM2_9FIRM|nr:PucC family protein [Candidatus Eisenbergiella intestinigallinarum]